MLKKRSGAAVGSKPSLMCDLQAASLPLTGKLIRPNTTSSLLLSPRPLASLLSPKNLFLPSDPAMSPTSMLESKNLPCLSPRNPPLEPHSCHSCIGSPVTGLADVLAAEGEGRINVLFGSHLKLQVSPKKAISVCPSGLRESPRSPIEFGIKNRDSQLALLSPVQRSPLSPASAARALPGEMELSEDYTCVIARGPNPRTTHIFDNCVVESCGDVLAASWKEASAVDAYCRGGESPPELFLELLPWSRRA